MSKYFSVERIKAAIEHLCDFDSKWVIPPFVFACNGVDDITTHKDLSVGVGTDGFLDKFFSGDLIGLPRGDGAGSLRPKFKEIAGKKNAIKDSSGKPIDGTDYVVHQKVKLWGSGYSRNGYEAMLNRGELEKLAGSQSSFRLTSKFKPAFESELPANFCFEEFLVWLFAFKELPDTVVSWSDLWSHFKSEYLSGGDIPAAYSGRFKISSPAIPWPADFLSSRPDNLVYQMALLPNSFVESLDLEVWKEIRDELKAGIAKEYDGLSATEENQIARSLVSGLSGTKRVFLLGDPGTGKSTLTKLVKKAFEKAVDESRLFFISTEVTDKTTESTLVGFTGLDGSWIPGVLTAPLGERCLLSSDEDLKRPEIRNQVNLIVLDETNRKDIESLLARLQTSLDCTIKDPRDDSHKIALGKSGVRWISPNTFFLMTGNSPKDDEGRVEQSRPFKRRPALVPIPNPLGRWIQTASTADFVTESKKIWKRAAPDSQAGSLIAIIEAQIDTNLSTLATLQQVFIAMDKFRLGVSYGLLKKVITLAANEVALGADTFNDAVDAALAIGVSALLSSRNAHDGRSPKDELSAIPDIETQFPRFSAFVLSALGDVSDFGTVDPHF